MSAVPEPQKGSYSGSPARKWLRIGVSNNTRGFWVGWSSRGSALPPMIILGLGTRQIVAWSRAPRNGTFAPFLRTTQPGSWLQWYQDLPIAQSPLSQMTWLTISKPIRSSPWATSAAWTPACQTYPTVREGTRANASLQSTRVSPESVVLRWPLVRPRAPAGAPVASSALAWPSTRMYVFSAGPRALYTPSRQEPSRLTP